MGATSDGRTDEVEDADRTLDVVLGLGVASAIIGAFAFAGASASCRASAGTGVSAIASTWASVMWMPHFGRWSSRLLIRLYSSIASKSLKCRVLWSCRPFCRIICSTAMRLPCGRTAQMMSTGLSVIVFR